MNGLPGCWRKLTPADVAEMIVRYRAGGVSKAALGREYGIAQQTVDYHLQHFKASQNPVADALQRAAEARRAGNIGLAARMLRLAASEMEEAA